MIGKGSAIPEFVDRITEAVRGRRGRADVDVLLRAAPAGPPRGRRRSTASTRRSTPRCCAASSFDVDAQQVRRYFDFAKVRAGLLDVTGRLFDVEYVEVADAPRWHEDVTSYDVLRGRRTRLGRIHLDLHPRAGKYGHAAQFDLAPGIAGRQLAEGVLVCNFSRALMEHDHVVTLFHEFGHLVHHVLAGGHAWARFSGRRHRVGLRRGAVADARGVGLGRRRAAVVRDRRRRRADPARAGGEDAGGQGVRQGPLRPHPDVLRRAVLHAAPGRARRHHRDDARAAGALRRVRLRPGHALLRVVRAPRGLRLGLLHLHVEPGDRQGPVLRVRPATTCSTPTVAHRYRDRVLAPGGTRDAADLVADFLGRPYAFDAFERWLDRV